MSDADDQMGGSGGETGRPPGGEPTTPAAKEAEEAAESASDPRDRGEEDRMVEETGDTEDSFPASDPPSNY
jgi:hypothetical protein